MLIYLSLIIINKIFFATSLCEEGKNSCIICSPITGLCLKCEKNIYSPNQLGGCDYRQNCIEGMNHCALCNYDKLSCLRCEYDYFPDKYGGCSYTDNCLISENGKCLQCKEGFILIGLDNKDSLKICKSLKSDDLQNCENINLSFGTCFSCKQGFYLNKGDNKCIKTQYCEESSFGICKKCSNYYYLNKKENKCIVQNKNDIFSYCKETIDGEKCDKCEEGFYFDKYGNCVRNNFCEKVGNFGQCQKCNEGYYLTSFGDSCTKDKNCDKGNKDFGICLYCKINYYLDNINKVCKSNQENNEFKYCILANDSCYECIFGYHIGEDNKCSSSYNCAESENGICIKCKSNYYMGLDNRCSSIEHCIYSNRYSDKCLECEDNFYYDMKNETCLLSLDKNFTNCKSGYSGYNCIECKNDFYLNQKDKLCYNNNNKDDKFYKCAKTDSQAEECIKCIENYYLGSEDKKCSIIKGCDLLENENKCLKCNSNYCLDVKTGKCEDNNEIENENKIFYYRCLRTNDDGTACEVCQDEYILNDKGLCIDDKHCIEKKNGICQKCLIDNDNIFCLNNFFGCSDTFDRGCLECNNLLDLYMCTKCLDGYELDHNNNCIEKE